MNIAERVLCLMLVGTFLLLTGCVPAPKPCLAQGEAGIVVGKGTAMENSYRGRGFGVNITPFSIVKVRGPKIGTRICRVNNTSYVLLENGDPIVGPWGTQ